MRQGEMLSLSWSDIDLDKRIGHLDMTKNGESRDVPLSTRALEALQTLKEMPIDDRVIPSTRSAVQQSRMSCSSSLHESYDEPEILLCSNP